MKSGAAKDKEAKEAVDKENDRAEKAVKEIEAKAKA